MASAINEVDADYEVQIQEIRRLISSTSDSDRREMLEEQLRDLEVARAQHEAQIDVGIVSAPPRVNERRKSFRPSSAKPRMPLIPLAEDKEVHVSTTPVRDLDSYRTDSRATALVVDVLGTSYDELHAPLSVLQQDHHTFWMSSGMFPQLLRLALRAPTVIASVEVMFRHIHKMYVRTALNRYHSQRLKASEMEFTASESEQLTTHRFSLDSETPIEVVEVGIESGFADFVMIYWIRLIPADESEDSR